MYEKILVPLDGSKRAEAILPHVKDIARQFDSEIILITVVEPAMINVEIGNPMGTPAMGRYQQALIDLWKHTEAYLERLMNDLREEGFRAKFVLEYGAIVETIADYATSEDVDLVAIASHGRSGFGHLFYGSVAAAALNRLEKPILVIRSRDEDIAA